MTDSHTHLTSDELLHDVDRYITNFVNAGGEAILNVAHNYESINQSFALHRKYSTNPKLKYLTAIGLHPDNFSVSSLYPKTYGTFESTRKVLEELKKIYKLNHDDISAVGETGLDYYRFPYDEGLTADQIERSYELQKIAFSTHIELADKYALPLTIHTREKIGQTECISDTLRIVAEVGEGRVRGCFHSFTGDIRMVDDILNIGFYIGFNGIITYGSADNVREIASAVPIERMLLETDAPYLPPRSVRNRKKGEKHGQPADIREIAEKLAEIKSVSVEELLRTTSENFHSLFGDRS